MIGGMFKDLIAFRRDPLTFFEERGSQASEPLVKLSMGPYPVYLVTDPELIRPVLRADESVIDKGRLIYKLREVIGDSSMVISGERHRQRRAALHAQLSKGVASTFVPEICAAVRSQSAHLARQESFDAHRATAPLAVRIIAAILFGGGVLTPGDEATLVTALHLAEDDLAAEIFKLFPDLPWVRHRKKKKLKQAKDAMHFVVQKARKQAKRHSLIAALEELDLTEKEMSDEILLLLLAGHHTSGTAAAWILYHLATMPDVAEAVAREAAAMTGPDGEIEAGRLSQARVSMALVKETLRLYPSAYWLSRETRQKIELGGRRIPKGASLLISPWHMHRDPRNWDNPEEFRLDRDPKGAAYLPFGAGPRVCVGMALGLLELQLIALEFASAFRIHALDAEPPGRPIPAITIVPPPIRLSLTPRYLEQRRESEAA